MSCIKTFDWISEIFYYVQETSSTIYILALHITQTISAVTNSIVSVYSLKQALRVQLNVKTAHAHTLFIKKSVILVCSGPGISFSKRAPLSFLRLTRTPDIHFLSSDSAVLLWNFKNWIRVLTAVSASQIATGTSSPEPSSVSHESSWRACLVRGAGASVVMFLFFRVSLIVVKPGTIKKKLLLYFLKSLCRRECNILSH